MKVIGLGSWTGSQGAVRDSSPWVWSAEANQLQGEDEANSHFEDRAWQGLNVASDLRPPSNRAKRAGKRW